LKILASGLADKGRSLNGPYRGLGTQSVAYVELGLSRRGPLAPAAVARAFHLAQGRSPNSHPQNIGTSGHGPWCVAL